MVRSPIFSLVSVLVLGQIFLVQFSRADDKTDARDLKAFCRGKNVKLHTVEDFKRLMGGLKKCPISDCGCSEQTMAAMLDMETILKDEEVCTMKKVESITKFVSDHLKDSKQSDDTDEDDNQQVATEADEIPKPLAEFAIAYGMRISRVCSKNMMEVFAPEAEAQLIRRLGEEDALKLEKFFTSQCPVGLILKPLLKPGEIILPSDLMQAAPGTGAKLGIYLSNSTSLDSLKRLCKFILQPLYEPILLPLAHLIRAGFNNRDFYWRQKFHQKQVFWSVSVFLCETVKLIKVDDNEGEQVEDEKLLSTKELNAAIKDVDWTDLGQRLEADDIPHFFRATFEYVPNAELGGDIFADTRRSLIRSFDANRSEVERLQKRIRKRSFKLFFALTRKDNLKRVMLKILKSLTPIGNESKKEEEARQTMIRLIEAPRGNTFPYRFYSGAVRKTKFVVTLLVIIVFLVPSLLFDDFKSGNSSDRPIENFALWLAERVNYKPKTESD